MEGKEIMLDADELVGELDAGFNEEYLIAMRYYHQRHLILPYDISPAERDKQSEREFYKGLEAIS